MINLTNRIQKIFDKLKAENKKAFISFSVGGYPDEESSLEIAKGIADSGSHIHEISFPHAEAQADGPIIQLANIESIKNGANKIIMGRSLIKGNIEENIDKVSSSIKE